MNVLATKYAWRCSRVVDGEELITAAVKLFLLALAYRIPTRASYETEPTTLAMLNQMTGISERYLRRMRDMLVRIGELQEGGTGGLERAGRAADPAWPKYAVYRLPGLAGPLFLVTPWDVDDAAKSELSSGFPNRKYRKSELSSGQSRNSVPGFGRKAGGVLSGTNGTSTNHHDDDEPGIAALLADAHGFLDRWCAAYPDHNGGARYTLSVEDELPVVLDLLKARGAERLWEMALALWSCTPRQDDWIPTTDRSIRVLRQAANTLDRLATRAAIAPASGRASADDPSAVWGRVLEALKASMDIQVLDRVRPLVPVRLDSACLMLQAPTAAFRDAIPEAVEATVRAAVKEVAKLDVEFTWGAGAQRSAVDGVGGSNL